MKKRKRNEREKERERGVKNVCKVSKKRNG